jgi:hypothetical protein
MTGAVVSTIFKVGYRYRCTMTAPMDAIRRGAVFSTKCEWEPRVPARLWPNEVVDYRRSRDAFYAEVAKIIGGNVAIAELGDDRLTVVEPRPSTVVAQ